jgi:integrase/recombinase XerD
MSTLSAELDRYLTIRRGLGYDLGTAERILRRFTAFAEHENTDLISTAVFLRWQETFGHANRHTWSRRLGTVRLFAQWMHGMDQRHEVPPQALIPGRQRRPRPYIYSEEEIRCIVEAAAELPSINGIRTLTCSTLFGLIAVTGLRVSEALSFDVADVDLEAGLLTLRRGKLGKARLLPVSDSTTIRLFAYAYRRKPSGWVFRLPRRYSAEHQQVSEAAYGVGAAAESKQEDPVAGSVVIDDEFVIVGDVDLDAGTHHRS